MLDQKVNGAFARTGCLYGMADAASLQTHPFCFQNRNHMEKSKGKIPSMVMGWNMLEKLPRSSQNTLRIWKTVPPGPFFSPLDWNGAAIVIAQTRRIIRKRKVK